MTIPTWAKWGAATIAALLLVLAAKSFLDEHDARIKAEATVTAQASVIKDAQSKIDAAKQSEAQNQADLAAQLKAIAAQRTVIVTPQQAAATANTIAGPLPQPVQAQTVAATPTEPAHTDLVIPQADIPAFQQYKLTCDQNTAENASCKLTTANLTTQLDGTKQQLAAMTAERDAYMKASKGTFWGRFGKAVCHVVGSSAGAYVGGKQSANGAAIGAAVGSIGCEFIK